MNGVIKSVSGGTITFADGSTHTPEDEAIVTLNGKPSKLTELRSGDKVTLSGDPATSVAATR